MRPLPTSNFFSKLTINYQGILFLGPDPYGTLPQAIARIFPNLSNASTSKLEALYPDPINTTETGQVSKIFADFAFNCNRYALSTALPDSTYNVVFTMQPGIHGTSPTLIFTDSPWAGSEQDLNPTVQYEMRRFVMNFVVSGNPNEAGGKGVSDGVEWPVFGSKGMGLSVSGQNMTVVSAIVDKEVCDWWNKGLVLT